MYDLVDQPVSRLSQGSQFLLWCMRRWSDAAQAHFCPLSALSPAFMQTGAFGALGEFHDFMLHLHRASGGHDTLGPRPTATINDVEAVLLTMWRRLADSDGERARDVIELMVDVASVEATYAAAENVVARLAVVGMPPTGLRAAAEHPRPRPI